MFEKGLAKIFSTFGKNKMLGSYMILRINDKVMPIDRGNLYEDPIDEFLRANNYGEVTGGGTMQAETGEIEFCEVEIFLYENQDIRVIIEKIINELEELGAPKGSEMNFETAQEKIYFGRKEGIAIYLDGINLQEEVYKDCDVNFVLSELSRLLGYDNHVLRFWEGTTETALYFYGDSFHEMRLAISGFVNTYPLCLGARIKQIA